MVRAGGKAGFINRQGEYLVEPRFYEAGFYFDHGFAPVRVEAPWGPYGYIDRGGKMVIPARFLEAAGFSEGMACVRTDKGYGFIDPAGDFITSPLYENLGDCFEGGLVPFELKGKWGYLNRAGEVAIKPVFDAADWFHGDLAGVNIGGTEGWFMMAEGGRWGWIDKSGGWIWKPTA